MENLMVQSEYVLRIIVAALCGLTIGLERESRMKVAGIRTHLMVALASALMMVVSKYGFDDVLHISGMGLDPSRIAAGIVTGVSFIGAGLIFVRNRYEVSGITTAAGVWATVGVGMAIGAGMYYIGIISTVLILFNQFILHKNIRLLKDTANEEITLHIDNREEAFQQFEQILHDKNIELLHMKIKKRDDNCTSLKFYARFPRSYSTEEIIAFLHSIPDVSYVEF